ncbi:hypothetical protein J437_LFUL003458 [Ladona fulva]|uniref:beta-N-acetylhexosaminidase n=1 Tax=Ladona fulva TaxID=123851 RepID=A0A8K0NW34_LADFU|nr:hypothetical protein J437_LFUL003458 [Ladona fulva]
MRIIITKKGYSALLSSCWYLDGLETGGDWERFYNCDPDNFPGTPEQKKLVIGGEACMWSEVVDRTNVESRVWPRACAAAEKLWSSPEVLKDHDKSAFDMQEVEARLEEHRCRLLMRGIQAQPPNGWGFCPGEIF